MTSFNPSNPIRDLKAAQRLTENIHKLDSKDLKALTPRERYVLNCILKNKEIKSSIGFSLNIDDEMHQLANKLVTIRSQKNLSPPLKDSRITKLLNKIGIFTESQKLHKKSENLWNQLNPSYSEAKIALDFAEKAEGPNQNSLIFNSVEHADPIIAKDLIEKAVTLLKNNKGDEKRISALENKIYNPLYQVNFTKLTDEGKFDEVLKIIENNKDSKDYNDYLGYALRTLDRNNPRPTDQQIQGDWGKFRLEVAKLLVDHVRSQTTNPKFKDIKEKAYESFTKLDPDRKYNEYLNELRGISSE